jgi:membrane protease YdiL (CAAX protease family)
MDGTTVAPEEARWLRSPLVASWPEIILVMGLTTGLFLLGSIWSYLHGSSTHFAQLILNDRRLTDMIAREGALLGLMLIYLRHRGWIPADFRVRINLRGSLLGLVLPIPLTLANLVTILTLFLLAFLMGGYAGLMDLVAANKPELTPHSVHVTWFAIVVACVVNAYLEEITCTAYFFNQVAARHGPFAALLLTDMVRMSFHLYQGPLHMLGIGAVFLVLNGCYWWTRNLWPLVVAHTLVDIIGMGVVKEMLG